MRGEVCDEAIRLAELLAKHPAGNQPRTHALLALMLLNAARLPTRVDADGSLLRLKRSGPHPLESISHRARHVSSGAVRGRG